MKTDSKRSKGAGLTRIYSLAGEAEKKTSSLLGRYLRGVSVAWLLLGLISIVLSLVFERSALNSDILPLRVRQGLVSLEALRLAGATAVVGGPLLLFHWLGSRMPQSRKLPHSWNTIISLIVIYGIVFLYASSWAAFWSLGHFLDLGSAQFWLASPILLFQHILQIEPWLLVIVPISSLLATVAGFLLLTWLNARPEVMRRSIPVLALGCLGVAYWDSPPGENVFEQLDLIASDLDVGTSFTLADHFVILRDERTGPLSRLWADLRQRAEAGRMATIADAGDLLIADSIVTMNKYLSGVKASPSSNPNIILIIVESLRSDQLRAYGSPQEIMPALEELSREGRVFTNHRTTATHSNYASVVPVSAHYPLRSARYHIYPENPSYPRVMIYDILKAVGYRTAIISSQNEIWGGMIHYLHTGSIDYLLHSETYDGPTYTPDHDMGFARFITGANRAGKIDDRFTVQKAIEWIEEDVSNPFFIYMNLQNSHLPYITSKDFPRKFGPAELSFPIKFNNFPPDSADLVKGVYASSLAYVDHQLGKLFEFLRERDLWNQTIVIVTGDHGQAFFEHGFAAHGNQVYEELLRTPLIIRGPGVELGIDHRPAQHVDVAPSILDLVGLPPHPGHQGISLFTVGFDPDRPLFSIVQTPLAHQYAVTRSGYKLIHDVRWKSYRLYDLNRDPHETLDLSKTLPMVTDSLRQLLDAWSTAQIQYYSTTSQHTQFYPPVLAH